VERRLAAILAADVVGYSRLMEENEVGTLAQLKTDREEVLGPFIVEHHGRIVKLMGDGLLAEFPSAVEAVQCAVEIQHTLSGRKADVPEDKCIAYRIGINIGDIIVEGEDIYGDGVNVAARLEGLAERGGICVSRTVVNHVKGKVELDFEDLGDQQVKNISEPVRVYLIVLERPEGSPAAGGENNLALPDKPSIAVLPFANLSGDPEQEFFADGMAEEITTALSRYRWFFVIARNSSFTYKGRAVDVTQVAKELGVRYVLEGSVRKATNRVRVTAQLIDATTGSHIWAERYDRELDDIFALQDEITETIVAAIEPELGAFERERAHRKPPESLDAWSSYQRGLWHFFTYQTRDSLAEAKQLFQHASDLDPGFATAYAELAWTHVADIHRGFTDDPEASLEQATRAAEKAVTLDPRDPVAHFALGRVHIFNHAYENAIAEMETALGHNASSDRAYYCLGLALLYGGRPAESVKQLEKAIRLNPRSPIMWAYLDMLGRAYFNLRQYEEAAAWFSKATQQPHASFLPFVHAAAAMGHLSRADEACGMLAEGKRRNPEFSADTVERTIGVYGRHSGADEIINGLRMIGFSEK
jgi:adenylate cyclase